MTASAGDQADADGAAAADEDVSTDADGVDPLENRVRIRIARFVGFSVGITALFLWTLLTDDPITGALAAVPIGYLAYRAELALFRLLDVRILEFL